MAIKRKNATKVTATVKKVSETPKVKEILWRIHSGSLLLDGKRYNANGTGDGSTFYAPEEAISEAFRDTVKPVVPKDKVVYDSVIKFKKVEVETTDEEKAADGYVSMYNVVNLAGASINPSPLSEEDADALLGQLN